MAAKYEIIKGDIEVAEIVIEMSPKIHNEPKQRQRQRLVSLDIFRGLTVAIMILVDNAGGIIPAINHSPWNGVTLADFVMPFFLFMVGVSLALTYKSVSSSSSSRVAATRKAILRALKLFILGLFFQGGFFHRINDLTYGVDITQIRWMGILQRIAISYFVAAMCEIWLKGNDDHNHVTLRKYRYQWIMMVALSSIYMFLLYGVYVPDWEYASSLVICGVRGDSGPACNVVGMIDRKVLGIQHLYRKPIYARTEQCSINSPDYGPLPLDAPSWCQAPFDPEGLVSSIMASVTCLVGLQYGHIIVHFKDHKDRIFKWVMLSTCFVSLGVALDLFGMHVNKALYTFSYMCVTAGAAGVVFAGIYCMVDVCGYSRGVCLVFEWMGLHALEIYIIVACNILPVVLQGFYWRQPGNNIFRLVGVGK